MNYSVIKILSIIFLCFSAMGLSAQETVTTAGGEATDTTGSASFTIGQTVYTTNTDTSGSVAQGVQQPYEISVVIGIDKAKEINLSFSAYPNPANKYVVLNIGNYDFKNLNIQLYDLNGKLLKTIKAQGIETKIDMSELANGIYFINLIDNNKMVKTFKIIKNK